MVAGDFFDGNARILLWKMEESEEALKSELLNFDFYESEFNRIGSPKRRLEFLTARVALQTIADSEIQIVYNAEGKPSVNNQSFKMSISHTGKWLAVIVHPSVSVGIDVELPSDKFEKVYKRFLSAGEQSRFYLPDDLRKVLIAWSVKESLYKIVGQSAVSFDKDIEIADFCLSDEGEVFATHTLTSAVYRLVYRKFADFYLVYCVDL